MKNFTRVNNVVGWLVFAVAALTYILTLEPTVSWWDCGEFISSAYKLEVGHPPGAPLFMLFGRIFTLFAFGDVSKVAMMVNLMSALASAFTILFLFWSITHIAKKIVVGDNEMTDGKLIAVISGGAVGALAFAFSDSFWFSAVEGEVYASSSFFTAIVFWAILKWENVADEPYANRWIILIAYLMGLSIGVHLLNLLAIPAIVFVYYFRKYNTTRNGVIITALLSVAILGTVLYGVVQGFIAIGSKFELLFVNSFKLPYYSGFFFFLLLLVCATVWGIYYSYKKGKVIINTVLTALAVIMIGYSSYAMIMIRSAANPPMDENNPEEVFALLSYLNREQYGDRPLLFGQCFNAPIVDSKDGHKNYVPLDGKYVVADVQPDYIYDPRFMSLFPRMYSSEGSHVKGYKTWSNFVGTPIQVENDGEMQTVAKPTFAENLTYFFRYQVGFMYFRYFLWNFAGKQNDTQGHGSYFKGNWISGISAFDGYRLVSQHKLPKSLAENRGHNKYFLLPFLLGVIGLLYLFNRNIRMFWVVLMFFFFTGLAIVIYLNQTPYQPRERDYAYAGSFYVYGMFIGFGVLSIFEFLSRKLRERESALIAGAICLVVPVIMGMQNWDDHDRSGRYSARDLASNYLNSCAPNAILFTYGDNDTFPLWYAQEVEGIRTDVRVVNMSLLGTDWYIDQMKRKAYLSDPVPFTLDRKSYITGTNEYLPVLDKLEQYTNLRDIISFIASDSPEAKLSTSNNKEIGFIPTKKVFVPVDSATVVNNGTVAKEDAAKIVKSVDWVLNTDYVYKSQMMMLDLIANNRWQRPIYFANSVDEQDQLGLSDYLQLEGFAYRLVPIKTKDEKKNLGRVDTKILYRNLIQTFKWGRIGEPDFNLDEHNLRTINIMDIRGTFGRLADALLTEGKKAQAIAVVDTCIKYIPHEKLEFNYYALPLLEAYYKADALDKALDMSKKMGKTCLSELNYFLYLSMRYSQAADYEININLHIIQQLIELAKFYKQDEWLKELETRNTEYMRQYTTNRSQ